MSSNPSNSDLFIKAKEQFIDTDSITAQHDHYIFLESFRVPYQKLMKAAQNRFKMTLLYGKPGCGKSALLKKVHFELLKGGMQNVLYFASPSFFASKTVQKTVQSLNPQMEEFDSVYAYLAFLKESDFSCIALLDEAQLYTIDEMEALRLLSDTGAFKFVLAVHKTEKEDITVKQHFSTRIWENVGLHELGWQELSNFVLKKLTMAGLSNVAAMLTNRDLKFIYRLTNGNIRESIKFFYTLFDFYDFLEKEMPSELNYTKVLPEHIEMIALQLGHLRKRGQNV